MSKLTRLPQSRPLSQRTPIVSVASLNALSSDAIPSTSSSYTGENSTTPRLKEKLVRKGADWKNYDKIRRSRQARERRRRGNSNNESQDGDVGERECPVCDKSFSSEEIERHTTRCLRQAETEFEDEEVDVEGDEYEEYEWCGVTRVRATTLLAEDQLHAIGTKVKRGSEDEMVDVCDDDVEAFGPSQYSDRDLGSLAENGQASNDDSDYQDDPDSLENLDRNQESSNPLRQISTTCCTDGSQLQPSETVARDSNENLSSTLADSKAPSWSSPSHGITSDSNSPVPNNKNMIDGIGTENSSSSSVWPKDSVRKCEDDIQPENPRERFAGDEVNDSIRFCSQGGAVVGVGGAAMEALRARVRELEEERTKGRYACRVCHGDYDKPVVSIACWHVHCETCWLHALAAKKLCPQCSVITSTSDLRRVYF
ncbi:E3 ubiquitin-protein ligase RNF220-like [Palaemon carinicauda]|uniref:E3 ubiquitin-protein ligase RNF220-like n=1 Tax=Palaemon carinicauda TaxID=392227 RepID=UPI0035B62BB9